MKKYLRPGRWHIISYNQLRVNAQRLQVDFGRLAEIGATLAGGVHRPSLSEADLRARQWLRQRITAAGLEARQDGAGNLSAFLGCGPQEANILLLGSHLDSVPDGGRFDGALGLLAALEVLRVVQENALRLPYHLEGIDFTDEEGTLVGLLGSSALVGQLKQEDLSAPRVVLYQARRFRLPRYHQQLYRRDNRRPLLHGNES